MARAKKKVSEYSLMDLADSEVSNDEGFLNFVVQKSQEHISIVIWSPMWESVRRGALNADTPPYALTRLYASDDVFDKISNGNVYATEVARELSDFRDFDSDAFYKQARAIADISQMVARRTSDHATRRDLFNLAVDALVSSRGYGITAHGTRQSIVAAVAKFNTVDKAFEPEIAEVLIQELTALNADNIQSYEINWITGAIKSLVETSNNPAVGTRILEASGQDGTPDLRAVVAHSPLAAVIDALADHGINNGFSSYVINGFDLLAKKKSTVSASRARLRYAHACLDHADKASEEYGDAIVYVLSHASTISDDVFKKIRKSMFVKGSSPRNFSAAVKRASLIRPDILEKIIRFDTNGSCYLASSSIAQFFSGRKFNTIAPYADSFTLAMMRKQNATTFLNAYEYGGFMSRMIRSGWLSKETLETIVSECNLESVKREAAMIIPSDAIVQEWDSSVDERTDFRQYYLLARTGGFHPAAALGMYATDSRIPMEPRSAARDDFIAMLSMNPEYAALIPDSVWSGLNRVRSGIDLSYELVMELQNLGPAARKFGSKRLVSAAF